MKGTSIKTPIIQNDGLWDTTAAPESLQREDYSFVLSQSYSVT